MNSKLVNALKRFDTPTICNAIEVAQNSRNFHGFTKTPVVPSDAGCDSILGQAMTAKIRAKSPSEEPPDRVRSRRMAYYEYISKGPRPGIVVIEDLDAPAVYGAFWGEINATVHKAFGLAGAVTNGQIRDLGELPSGFPILAGSVGVSHAHVRIVDFDLPVSVMGLEVHPGDWIHADRHGALVIPNSLMDSLAGAVQKLLDQESLVLDVARNAKNYDFEIFKSSWEAFEKHRS